MKKRKTKGAVMSAHKLRKNTAFFLAIQENQKLILLTAFFLCGVLLGTLWIRQCSPETFHTMDSILLAEMQKCAEQSSFSRFLSRTFVSFSCLAVIALLGLNLFGEIFLWFFPFLQGLSIGTVASILYKQYALDGLKFYSAVLWIPLSFLSVIFLFSMKESILFSRDIRSALQSKTENAPISAFLRPYAVRYAVLSVMLTVCNGLYAILCTVFREQFTLFSAVQ